MACEWRIVRFGKTDQRITQLERTRKTEKRKIGTLLQYITENRTLRQVIMLFMLIQKPTVVQSHGFSSEIDNQHPSNDNHIRGSKEVYKARAIPQSCFSTHVSIFIV